MGHSDGGYELIRVKREWVPDWLWRLFCVGNFATFTPWKEVLTRKSRPKRTHTLDEVLDRYGYTREELGDDDV